MFIFAQHVLGSPQESHRKECNTQSKVNSISPRHRTAHSTIVQCSRRVLNVFVASSFCVACTQCVVLCTQSVFRYTYIVLSQRKYKNCFSSHIFLVSCSCERFCSIAKSQHVAATLAATAAFVCMTQKTHPFNAYILLHSIT